MENNDIMTIRIILINVDITEDHVDLKQLSNPSWKEDYNTLLINLQFKNNIIINIDFVQILSMNEKNNIILNSNMVIFNISPEFNFSTKYPAKY